MSLKIPIECEYCGRSFTIELDIGSETWTDLARNEIKINEMVIIPHGNRDYLRKHWKCPMCSVLKERDDVKAWLEK